MNVYFDNAATTPLRKEVIDVVSKVMEECYGNPSSVHAYGRTAKTNLETARKGIAKLLNAAPQEIIFTSGGTESDNMILQCAVKDLGVTTIISSRIEHHAILHAMEALELTNGIKVLYVNVKKDGSIDFDHLEILLHSDNSKKLVSLMHVNNEIGNVLDLSRVGKLCHENDALFHTDAVQGIAHFTFDLEQLPVDFLSAAAHKFHGPKGVGFAYFKKGFGILPMLHGGEQEMGARSSTENVHSILGMEKALSIAVSNLEKDKNYIEGLKKHFISELKSISDAIQFNGLSSNFTKSSYTILNVRFPYTNDMLLFSLDMAGIAVSGGSACQSGSNKGSHVLAEILNDSNTNKTSVRFSFSKYTTKEEIDYVIDCLKK